MQSTSLFAKTPPLKLFFLASIPGAIGMLASALYQTVDGIFVGQFLGSTAFSALNLAMPFVIINFALADLVGVGSSVPISVALGRKQPQEANNIFTCACLLIVAAGLLTGILFYAAAPLLIDLMGADGEFAQLAVEYLRVYALCSPVTTIIFAMDNYLRICGYIRGSMFLNIFMSILSAGLEFLFLGVLHWGIWAAALATCSGMAISVLIAPIPFFAQEGASALYKAPFSQGNDPTNCLLRQPQLFEQYRRQNYLHSNECYPSAPCRAGRRLCIRDFDVCRRLYPTAALRHVRLAAAGRWL